MTGRTGYTAPTNGDVPDGPDQIGDVYAHFDPLVDGSVANAAALPSTGNFLGRRVSTQDTNDIYMCTNPAGSGTWVLLPGAPVPITIGSVPGTLDWSGMRVRRIGNRLFMDGRVASTVAITAGLNGGTLPVGARPVVDQVFPVAAMTSGFAPSFAAVNVATTGVIQLLIATAPAGTVFVAFDVSFELA